MSMNGSVVAEASQFGQLDLPISDSYIIHMAAAVDEFPVWGTMVSTRDRMLRQFFPTEPVLVSAMFSTIAKYVAFGWHLKGPIATVDRVHEMLHTSEHGNGWNVLVIKLLCDLFSQDNGAFMEIIRTDDDPRAPTVGLSHLDASRCYRTGSREAPVIYTDINGKQHLMKWYQIMTFEEFPAPSEVTRGYQYCCVTRLLAAAKIIRDIMVYKHEKISGQHQRAIHLVSGVSSRQVRDAIVADRAAANAEGWFRYVQPVIIGSIDPTANVHAATLELASLPDGFNEETNMRWYVNQLAQAFGGDYQDYAPLPGGNLGTAQQSEVLAVKAKGKGPALFMSTIEHKFNYHGVMPRNCHFEFGEQDITSGVEEQKLRTMRAEERKIRMESGEITSQVARQMALDAGDLTEAYLKMMGEQNATPDVNRTSSA